MGRQLFDVLLGRRQVSLDLLRLASFAAKLVHGYKNGREVIPCYDLVIFQIDKCGSYNAGANFPIFSVHISNSKEAYMIESRFYLYKILRLRTF